MKHIFCFIFWAGLNTVCALSAKAGPLDDLLKEVKEERIFQTQEFKTREARFKKEKTKQQTFLSQALKELKKEEKISFRLTQIFEKQEKELAILETELKAAVGVLGELFGVVKQTTGDFRGSVLHSIVSAEIPGRDQWAEDLAGRKKLPTTAELRQLWFELQREIIELGKVTQFTAEVISTDGKKQPRLVTRVGGFNLLSQGRYLAYQHETGRKPAILELSRQPERRFTRTISRLENTKTGAAFFALDPSRGSLISLLVRVPNILERIRQGGLVGLIIICVLILGCALSAERWWVIKKERACILSQLKNPQNPVSNNPIGQILMVYENSKTQDMETLELKLNEIIIKYLPRLDRGIGTIKILSVLAPLLGLLGTVIGMIITFQSITLFGTGDPKMMAGGISQALITTVLGLCCAIPLLFFHNVISSWARGLTQILEEQTAGLLARRMENNKSNNRPNTPIKNPPKSQPIKPVKPKT